MEAARVGWLFFCFRGSCNFFATAEIGSTSPTYPANRVWQGFIARAFHSGVNGLCISEANRETGRLTDVHSQT